MRRWSHAPGALEAVRIRRQPGTVERILELRRELAVQGHDCGPVTIAHHLEQAGLTAPSTGTIWRILKREGLIIAQPQKRPRSSLIRF